MNLFDEYSPEELLLIDVTFLNLYQSAWKYDRGARDERLYSDGKDGNVLIRDSYEYVMTNGNRDIAEVTRHITWHKNDGEVFLTKDLTKEMTVKSLEELNQTIRNGRITALYKNASLLPGGQQLVDAIFSWYEAEIDRYIKRGSLDFETALINETDPQRLGMLNMPIEQYGGLSVMNLISNELIGAYTW